MSFLRGSTNYVWCTTSVLGKGATGAVFQGVNKNNGEVVAVKTFNQLSHMRPQDVQMREFEVLKKVKHENIVKLLAIEEEQEGRGKVIVMELCTGGSLFNILDDPENTYGLQENEFLLVVEHLSAGMKHLRDNNLVHRDLKPGNIMKFIAEDGRTIYKLTDFGAARELHEDQQFMSLYGTEEYLHPDMYERAVLRKPVGKTFGATVDLWSIGVTLYHVATGNLPFRPYGGRKNKETMHFITTEKASGVISGTQTSDNGPIDWGRELPVHCELSDGLKKIVTPLLAGLLEVDTNRIWSFEKFFNEVTLFLARKIVHIFYVNKAKSLKVYMHLEDTLSDLQYHIQEQTGMVPASQLLLFGNKPLSAILEDSTPGRGYPETTSLKPIMLFSRDNNNVLLSPYLEIPKFPVFPNLVSVENDATMSKAACSVGHVYKRRIENLTLSNHLMNICVTNFTELVEEQLIKLHCTCENLLDYTNSVENNAETYTKSSKFVKDILKYLNVNTVKDVTDLKVPSDELRKNLMPAVQQLHHRYVVEHTLSCEWKSATRSINSPKESRADHKAKLLIERLRESWNHLLRDRATRTLTYNDEQFHVLERIKVMETGRRIKNLLDNDILPAVNQTTECLADWYKMAHTVFLQTRILEKDIAEYEQHLTKFTSKLNLESSNLDNHMQHTLKKLKNIIEKSKSPDKIVKTPLTSNVEIQKNLKTLMTIKSEISSSLNDNWEIMKELMHLVNEVNKPENCDINEILDNH